MRSRSGRQALVWGSVLILVGALLLVEAFTDLSAWVWVALLALGGLGAFGLYLSDRSDWWMLIPAYALWAIAVLVALVTLNVLRDEAVAFYVLLAVAMPFLAVYYRDRTLWWALIPAYVLMVIAVMIMLIELGLLSDLLVPAYILIAIAVPFFVVYARDRRLWWALIPAYVLIVIAVMIMLIELDLLSDLLVPAYILIAIAVPFFVVYARDRRLWWSLIPGGILAVIGLSFLIAEAAVEYIGALLLIVVGAWILLRAFTRREPTGEVEPSAPDAPAPTDTETDAQEVGLEE